VFLTLTGRSLRDAETEQQQPPDQPGAAAGDDRSSTPIEVPEGAMP
jgi:hypothetical protein